MFAVFLSVMYVAFIILSCYYFGIWLPYAGLALGSVAGWILQKIGITLSQEGQQLLNLSFAALGLVAQIRYIYRRWKPIVRRFIRRRKERKEEKRQLAEVRRLLKTKGKV